MQVKIGFHHRPLPGILKNDPLSLVEAGINPLDLLGPETIAGTTASRLGGTRVELRRIGPGRVAMFGRGLRDGEEIPTGWAPQPTPLNTDPEEEA